MPKKILKTTVAALLILFIAVAFSGCDLLSGLLGGGPPGGTDPITIQDSVADDPAYDSLENDFFVAINNERSTHSIATFASRDSGLDALARRYAKAGAVDTVPANLKSRVATALGGTCSDAAFFIGGSTTLSNYVSTLIGAWLAAQGGTDTMRSTAFTKIGIGMVVGYNIATPPGGTWHSVVVLLAKP